MAKKQTKKKTEKKVEENPKTLRPEVTKMLLNAGVKNLNEFGYPGCNADNITSDMLYKSFFEKMLEETKGRGYDDEVNDLLEKCRKG